MRKLKQGQKGTGLRLAAVEAEVVVVPEVAIEVAAAAVPAVETVSEETDAVES